MLSHPPIIDRPFDGRPESWRRAGRILGVKGAAELELSIRANRLIAQAAHDGAQHCRDSRPLPKNLGQLLLQI
jgi:hypothetical protein